MNTKVIKHIALACLLFATGAQAIGQVDRTKAPKPGPAKEIKLGKYETFTLKNGLQVFVVENHKLPRVQFSLQLRNNPPLEGDKAGYVDIAGDLLRTGTQSRNKAQLDEEIDFLGASLFTSSDGIFASSLSTHTEKLLDLMSDVLLHPAFRPEELDKLKTQTLSNLAASKDDPQSIAGNVRRVLEYGTKHPYGEVSTEETVSAIQLADCKKYYDTYFKPNNAYLAVVGDVDLKTARSLANRYFSSWKKGDVVNPTYANPTTPEKTYIALVDRPASVQSVINIAYPVELKPGSVDALPSTVMNEILGVGFSSRLMQDLREDKGFTYDARSSLRSDLLIGNFVASTSVRNEVTDSAVYELMTDLKGMENDSVTDKEMSFAKASIAGRFGRSLESPQTVASFAINTARYGLPTDYYENYVKMVDAVTKDQVHAAAAKFIRPDNAYILVVGKGADISDNLAKLDEVRYFDIHGNRYEPSTASAVPADLTAEKVLGHYLDAIGGENKVNAVISLKMVYKGSVQGTDLQMNVIRKAPDKALLEVQANGNTYMKMVVNGKKSSREVMGQKPEIGAAAEELQAFNGLLFKEAGYKRFGAKAALKGVERVNGKDAYVIEFSLPQGEKSSEYYDAETGLKVQTVQIVKTPQGDLAATVKFSDYRDVHGIKFPFALSQEQGPMTINYTAADIQVNGSIPDATFQTE